MTVLVKYGTSARVQRQAREPKGSVEFEERARKPTFPCAFTCSQRTRVLGSMFDEDRHTCGHRVNPVPLHARAGAFNKAHQRMKDLPERVVGTGPIFLKPVSSGYCV